MLEHVFSPIVINGMELKNRMVVTPMVTDYCNDDGTATEKYLAYHEEKAKGGFGLIITEDYNIAENGHGFKATAGFWNDGQIESHSALPPRVHKYGAKILAQIYHCGRQTNTGAIPGQIARSSSRIACPFSDMMPEPFTTEEVKEVVQQFADAAERAKKAGFDGVQIHAAHGYLITQFFSTYSNKRLDEYGGNFWNRTRFVREVIQNIRERCGKDFVIDIRLSGSEFVEGGLTIEDTKTIARMVEEAGVDMIHVSLGNYLTFDWNIPSGYRAHGLIAEHGRAVKEAVSIPVTVVGRINDPFLADTIIASGQADLVGMGRASLVDPAMPNKAKEGRFEDIRRCFGCDVGCIGVLLTDKPIQCVLNPELGFEYEGGIKPADEKKKIVVVGAGPGGLEAAIYAAKRGHDVTVFEKESHNGGQFFYAAVPPGKGEITDFLVWQTVQCKKLGVEIRYNTEATLENIRELNPDHVILASGGKNKRPPIPGLREDPRVVDPGDVLTGKVWYGSQIVVIGGALVGAETSHFLAQELRDVSIVEMRSEIATDAVFPVKVDINRHLDQWKVKKYVNTTVKEITKEGVVIESNKGEVQTLPCDQIVIAAGRDPYKPLEGVLQEAGIPYSVIGDANGNHEAGEALREAYQLCKTL
ncbi:MAG: FAD-dependent oxidoreductase [Lachnospiraceae bacterium]|nr:FAD-dependent oxidoreductase [Lachnospiraceae bacterium]